MSTSALLKIIFHAKKGINLKGTFSITSKGNGCLEISGLSIRIYDAHEDGVTFEGDLLANEAIDVNGDGYNDLVLTGTALVHDPSNENQINKVPIKAVFLFDPVTRKLVQTIRSPYIPVN